MLASRKGSVSKERLVGSLVFHRGTRYGKERGRTAARARSRVGFQFFESVVGLKGEEDYEGYWVYQQGDRR